MYKEKLKRYLSIAGLFCCALILGTHYVITKQLALTTDAVVLTGYRFLIAALPLFFYLLWIKKNPFKNIKLGLILGFFLGLTFICIAEGVHYTSAANAGFISGVFIIFVPIFSYWFFRKQPRLYYLLVLGLSLLGLYFLTGQLQHLNIGDLFILASAIFTAIHLVLVSHYAKQDIDARVLCFQQFLVVFVLSLLFSLSMNKNLLVSTTQIVPLLFLGLIATLSVFFVQMISLRYASEMTAALILAIQPVFAAVFAVFWGGEIITLLQAVGGALLVLAVVFNQLFPIISRYRYRD
jgi:drug/metabolite transporter (DMT)-like permease